MIVVEVDVKETLAVGSPYPRAVTLLDQVVEVGAGGPVADPDRKIFRAVDIGAPGFEPVIRRMAGNAEPEVLLRGSQLIAVLHDVGVSTVPRHAAELFVLTALAEFPEIAVGAIRRGHAGIVLLDTPAHFFHQRFLQLAGVPEQALGIAVLCLQIFPDIRIEPPGIAQHVLPIGILQPRIIVDQRGAVDREWMRPSRGHGRGSPNPGDVFCHWNVLWSASGYRPHLYRLPLRGLPDN